MPLCVLTGDIVGSMQLTPGQRQRIDVGLEHAYSALADGTHSSFDTYRGDGWQMAFDRPKMALRFALFIRARLRSEDEAFETRIALSTGRENWADIDDRAPPFVASGRALDELPRDVLMIHAGGGAVHAATLLADQISRGWTQAQARAIHPFLKPENTLTQKDVATELGVSRQAVGQALDAAGYGYLSRALTAIEGQAK